MLRRSLCMVTVVMFCTGFAFAHSHTHVGRNPDGIWGNADDNQLWIFATPDQPQWDTIEMLPTGEYIGGKQIYIAELDCWHSAEDDAYRLDSNDELTQPDWRISLKRVNYSDPVNFWIENEATTLEILLSDGAIFAFGKPEWEDEENWYFHTHTKFLALADGTGQMFSATFTVIDTGLTGFAESAQYTLNFVTVPEPTSMILFGSAMLAMFRTRVRK